jgi:Flp pilus assembly protein TadB/Mg-chelatase subunit ChlD
MILLPGAAAYADGTAQVTDTRLVDRQLLLTVRAPDVPAGTSLAGSLTRARVNGVERPVHVRTADAAAVRTGRAVVVVDSSGSMGKDGIAAARVAAAAFIRRVSPDVPVGLIRFSARSELLVAPTTQRPRLQAGLQLLKPQKGTALYDAVVMAAATAGRGGSVVVLSDGADTSSRESLGAATSLIRASDVSVSTVAFRTPGGSRTPLEQLAHAGHGQVVAADAAPSLAEAFTRAAAAVPAMQLLTVDLPEGTLQGSVDVTVSDGTRRWVAQGSFPGGASAAQLPSIMVGSGRWYSSLWTVVPLVFLAVVMIGWLAIPSPVSAGDRRQRALSVYSVQGRLPAGDGEDAEGAASTAIVKFFERLLKGRDVGARIAAGLDKAGSRLRPAEWLVIRSCVCLAFTAVVTLLAHHLAAGVLIGVPGGWAGTFAWLKRRQVKRQRAFADALPDTLQLVASSLRTGFSLPQALDAVQEDGVQPIAGELGRALAAARIGAPLEDELEEVGKRMQNEDWRWAVMAIRIQRSVGGNLAEVLLTTVRTLRERAATRRQVRALSAEGMLSAYILIGLPIFVSAILLLFRREYLRPLVSIPGVVMIVVAVALLAVGWFWMRKVVKVEV